jgi:secernin
MCDCLVALPGATGRPATLFAKNSDRPPTEAQDVVWSPPRRDAGPAGVHATYIAVDAHPSDTIGALLSRPRWCWGAEHGVNEAGVAIGNEAIYTVLDPRQSPAALIGMDLVRFGLERGDTAERAVAVMVDLLERYGQGGSGHDAATVRAKPYWSSFLVADPREAYVVETSGRTWATERVERARAISNRTTIPSFDAEHRHPGQPVDRLVDPRWNASQAVLAIAPVTVDALMAHLRSHDSCATPGWSVCMHVADVEETTASMVAELPSGGPPRAWVLVGHPCEEHYREVPVSAAVAGDVRDREVDVLRWEDRRAPDVVGRG